MHSARLYIILMTLPLFAFGADCPVSLPNMTDPAGTLSSSEKHAWYGTEDLVALIPRNGHWEGMAPNANYGNKFWWWSRIPHNEPTPVLVVVGELLDQPNVKARALKATSGAGNGWSAMLVLIEFPAPGCWQVTGTYLGQELKIVFDVRGSGGGQ